MKMKKTLFLCLVLAGMIWYHNLDHPKEAIDEAVGKFGDPKEYLSEHIKLAGDKAIEAIYAFGKTIGMISIGDTTEATVKDSLVKLEKWDLVDSPKRIAEDIEQNASRKIEQGVEEVKETVEDVKKNGLNELLEKSKNTIYYLLFEVLLEKIRSVISWCHLLGFATAYGIGVWVTFFWSCVLGKCLPKHQFGMMLNKMNMVYFRAMAYCVGVALFGFVVSQGRKGVVFSNKMVMFQGFNLLSALFMILINLIFLEPRETKLTVERMKMQKEEARVEAEKLIKKRNTYSSTLNVSTMVVLTWHLAYVGQLLQSRH